MAYTIQAIIGKAKIIRENAPCATCVVPLPKGMALLPITDAVQEAYGIDCLPLTDEGETVTPSAISAFASRFANSGSVAYIEAEFFGGAGVQAHVMWHENAVSPQPVVGQRAINEALRQLGVDPEEDLDEFDSVDLGRYRFTDDWAEDVSAEQINAEQA